MSPATSLRVTGADGASSPSEGHGGAAPLGFCVQSCGSAGGAPGPEGERERDRAEPHRAHRTALTGDGGAARDGLCVAHGRMDRDREWSGGSVRASAGGRTRSGTALAAIRSCRPAPPRAGTANRSGGRDTGGADRHRLGCHRLGTVRTEPCQARSGRVGSARARPAAGGGVQPAVIPPRGNPEGSHPCAHPVPAPGNSGMNPGVSPRSVTTQNCFLSQRGFKTRPRSTADPWLSPVPGHGCAWERSGANVTEGGEDFFPVPSSVWSSRATELGGFQLG